MENELCFLTNAPFANQILKSGLLLELIRQSTSHSKTHKHKLRSTPNTLYTHRPHDNQPFKNIRGRLPCTGHIPATKTNTPKLAPYFHDFLPFKEHLIGNKQKNNENAFRGETSRLRNLSTSHNAYIYRSPNSLQQQATLSELLSNLTIMSLDDCQTGMMTL